MPKPPRRRTYSTSSVERRHFYDHEARGGNIDLGLDTFADNFFGVIHDTSSSLAHSLGDEHAPGKSAGFGRSVVPPWEHGAGSYKAPKDTYKAPKDEYRGHGLGGGNTFLTPTEAGFTETPFRFQDDPDDPEWRGYDDPEWRDYDDDVGNHNYVGYHHDDDVQHQRHRRFPRFPSSSSFNKVSSGFGNFDFSRWADIKPFSESPSFGKEAPPTFVFRDPPVGFNPDYDFDEPPVGLGELHADYDVGRLPSIGLADLSPDYDFGGDIAPDYEYDFVGGGGGGHGPGFADVNTMTFGDILITTVKPPVIIVLNDTQGSPQNFKQLLTSDSYGVPKANLVSAGAYKAPKDTYKAPKDTYNAPKDAYKAPTDTYKTPVDSYKAPENAYKTPDASYNGIEDDLKAPGKNAAKMPSAAVTKPFALRRPVQNVPLLDFSFGGLVGGANSMMRAISGMLLPAGPLRLKHPLPKLPPLSSFTPPIHLAARRPRTLDGSSKDDSNRAESSTRAMEASPQYGWDAVHEHQKEMLCEKLGGVYCGRRR